MRDVFDLNAERAGKGDREIARTKRKAIAVILSIVCGAVDWGVGGEWGVGSGSGGRARARRLAGGVLSLTN